jgi:hypothetical protein
MTDWTEGRIKSFITSVLRSGYRRWPPKFETLKDAQVGKQVNVKTNRVAMHFKCKKCKGAFPATQVQVDHIKPVVDAKIGFVSWDEFITRLYCGKDNLQILCKECHNKKTLKETKQRTKK